MATNAEVAAHLDLSEASFYKLRSRGVLPPSGRGENDFDSCRVAYIRHLREQAAGREKGPEKLDVDREKARDLKESADARALKNAIARGEYVPVNAVTMAVVGMIELAKSRLMRVPAIAAGKDAALKERIAQALRDALQDLSATRLETVADEEEDGGDDPAAGG